VVEHRDPVALGVRPRDLDRVLDRLGAGVEQHGLLREVSRRQRGELLAHRDVPLVGRDHEAGVRERVRLLVDPLDDPWRGVADAGHRDTGGEVDQRVAVDVDQDSATADATTTGSVVPHTGRDARLPALVELLRSADPGSR
jgi:hypothetical protein